MADKKKKKFVERIKDSADVIASVGVIGAALVGVGTWCMNQAMATTNGKIDNLSNQITSIELNSTRNQLLTLISDYPDNEEEIMKVAKYYFQDLEGDWYMTTLFSKWAAKRGIDVDDIVKISGK